MRHFGDFQTLCRMDQFIFCFTMVENHSKKSHFWCIYDNFHTKIRKIWFFCPFLFRPKKGTKKMVCDLISLHHHMIILASFFFLLCAAVTMARRIIISCCKQSFALKFYEAYHAHFLRAIMCLNVWKNFAVVSRGAQGWWAPQFTVFENHKKSLI